MHPRKSKNSNALFALIENEFNSNKMKLEKQYELARVYVKKRNHKNEGKKKKNGQITKMEK